MRSRFLSVVSVILLLALVITACAPAATPAPTQAPTQAPAATKAAEATKAPAIKGGPLEVGVLWEEGAPWYDLIKEVGDSMEKDFPGTKVTYTFNNTAARPAIETRMKAGNPLDVDFIFEGMDPNSYTWVDNGYILDITKYMEEKRADGTMWKDDFIPLVYPSMQYKGKFYGAPEQAFFWLVHYNKKMFDDWGLKPATTWDEFLTLCETIKSKGVAPIAVTGQVNFYVGMWFDSLVQRYVGTQKVMDFLYGDKPAKLADDPGFLKAAQEMNKLAQKGYLIDGWQGTDFTTVQVYFFQGKAAMILMGSWLMTEMKASIPPDYKLAVAPFPSVADGKGNQTAIFGRALSWNVPAKSKNPDLAVEFLRRFTGKEAAQKRSDQLGELSVRKDVPPPAALIGMAQVFKDLEKAEFILYNYGITSAQFGAMNAWYDPLVEMWTGKLTPEQAIAKIDTNFESVRQQRAAAKK
jgi:raffinose/stachyose/melibiose transport system substrate-binding protein